MSTPEFRAEHDWTQRTLPGYAACLLDDDEIARVDAHLAACEACRELATRMTTTEFPRTGRRHIPADLLARWDRLSPKLEGLERELVQQHLDDCDQCRECLRVLGYEPVIAAVPAPARAPERPRVVSIESARAKKRPWILGWPGAGMLAAAAAALTAILQLPVLHNGTIGSVALRPVPAPTEQAAPTRTDAPIAQRSPDGTRPLPAPPPSPKRDESAPSVSPGGPDPSLAIEVALVSEDDVTNGVNFDRVRGSHDDGSVAVARADDVLTLPLARMLAVAGDTSGGVQVELFGPDGRSLLVRDFSEAQLVRRSCALRSAAGRFAPGRYRLVLRIRGENASTYSTYRDDEFVLR